MNRIRVSIKIPTDERFLVILDRNMHPTLQHFTHYIADRFKLPPHFKDHGFFIKELTLEKVKTIHEINKND